MQNQNIRALKAVVIILGLIIVAGLGVLAVGIGRQVGGARSGADATLPPSFTLPAGAEVLEMDLDGDRLAIRFAVGGAQSIQVFDARTGAPLATVALQP